MYRSANRRETVAEPEVWFRIVHVALDAKNGGPVAAYREQTVRISRPGRPSAENESHIIRQIA